MANEWIQQAAREFKDTVVQATQLPEEVGPYSVLAYLTGHKICILLTQCILMLLAVLLLTVSSAKST